MLKKLLYSFYIIIFTGLSALAKIDVVYPLSDNSSVSSDNIFFTGNVSTCSKFTINSENVKLWENSFFVHLVPLKEGKNDIVLKLYNGKNIESTVVSVNRSVPSHNDKNTKSNKTDFIPVNEGVLYSKTVKKNATVREKPSTNSKRVIDLPSGIVLYLDGSKGNYYRIKQSTHKNYWIHKSNITNPVLLSGEIKADIKKYVSYDDDLYFYHKFYLTYPVFFNLEHNRNDLKLTLFGAFDGDNPESSNFVFKRDIKNSILGYDCYYEGNNLILRIAKKPKNISQANPLKGIRIFIDAGHGGNEKGCIGPDRVLEKDINSDIANNLISLLQKSGAIVSYSRTDDVTVPLYDRVELAKKNNALISLSIHSNSLPYGKNPYEIHGTEVHYYNDNAKLLADIIVKNLSSDLNIKNNDIHRSSFALNRSTLPVSVLVEVAYMINPEEYILLKNPKFRKNVAKSLKKSIEEYISSFQNEKL